MPPFRKILFAADLSKACQAVTPYVREMTERAGAELVILHATEIASVPPDSLRPFLAESLPLYAAIRKEQRERLEAFIGEHFTGLRPELLLVDGEVGTAIGETVKLRGSDLVMMPTHGRGTLRRFLLGSVTAKMLHDLSCAVWTGVHWTDGGYQPRLPYRSIVCAVDFHEEDAGVIRAAGELAKAYGAKLSVTHAMDWPASNTLIEFPVYGREVVETALTRLVDEAELEATVSVMDGNPAEGVREAVLECEGDLLVVGRGASQKKVGRFWSNLYAIIRESPCPVLSV